LISIYCLSSIPGQGRVEAIAGAQGIFQRLGTLNQHLLIILTTVAARSGIDMDRVN
jgi:hypothetical protein|tara:strand:+ start:502 stop:669 length:168 start_codon:yes stop_codon:yes gene_type:complete